MSDKKEPSLKLTEESGGLLLRPNARHEFRPRPKESLLGLDALAAQKRIEQGTDHTRKSVVLSYSLTLCPSVKRPRLTTQEEDDSEHQLREGPPQRVANAPRGSRHIRHRALETPSNPGPAIRSPF